MNNSYDYFDKLCKTLPSDKELEGVTISEAAKKRIFRNIRYMNSPFLKTFSRRIATVLASLLIIFSLTLSVRAVRETVFEFTSDIVDGILSFSINNTNPKTVLEPVLLQFEDGEFSLVHSTNSPESYSCVFQSGNAQNYLVYQQNLANENFGFDSDAKYTSVKQRYIGDFCCYLIEQKGNTTLILFTDKYIFHLSANLLVSRVMDIAEQLINSNTFKSQNLSAVDAFFEPETLSVDYNPLFDSDNITASQKEKFFDIARKYHFGAIPSYFTEQEKPDFTSFMYYAYAMSPKEEQADFRGKSIENVARKYFGITYDLADDDIVSMPVGSLRDDLFAELVGYSCESLENDLYKVTAVFVDRNAFGLYYLTAEQQENWQMPSEIYDVPSEYRYAYDVMKQTGLTPFETVKHIITRGDGEKIAYMSDDPNYKQQYYTLTYTSKDGITPEKFLSSNRFYSK